MFHSFSHIFDVFDVFFIFLSFYNSWESKSKTECNCSTQVAIDVIFLYVCILYFRYEKWYFVWFYLIHIVTFMSLIAYELISLSLTNLSNKICDCDSLYIYTFIVFGFSVNCQSSLSTNDFFCLFCFFCYFIMKEVLMSWNTLSVLISELPFFCFCMSVTWNHKDRIVGKKILIFIAPNWDEYASNTRFEFCMIGLGSQTMWYSHSEMWLSNCDCVW